MSVVSTLALTRRFGGVAAVDALDLDVNGGVVGLLGPNGSGKTTLLRMLATVLSPTSGDVSIFGLDPARTSERTDIRRRLGYLPQEPGFYRGFSAFDLVDYVAVLKEMTERSARTDEVRRVLAAVDLADVMHKKIRALSGGQRQRVALAAALLGSPDLLVLDEPATGLDPAQRLQLRSLLSEHGRQRHGRAVDPPHGRGRRVLPAGDRHAARPGALRRHAVRARPAGGGPGVGR